MLRHWSYIFLALTHRYIIETWSYYLVFMNVLPCEWSSPGPVVMQWTAYHLVLGLCLTETQSPWTCVHSMCHPLDHCPWPGWATLRANSRFAPSQWETALQSNDVSYWLGDLNFRINIPYHCCHELMILSLWFHSLQSMLLPCDKGSLMIYFSYVGILFKQTYF